MAKVTGKFQITLPKAAVTSCGIRVGETLEVHVAGDSLHLVRRRSGSRPGVTADRLRAFDAVTRRLQAEPRAPRAARRGWTRQDLYDRGRAR